MAGKKLQILGSGSYGTVFLGVLSSSSSGVPAVFAVKSSELRFSPSLKVEGRFLNALRGCPHIIQGFGDDTSFEHGRYVYNLLLEYAPGGSLQNLIKKRGGNIPEFEVSYYAYQLLKGILDVHNRGFVHCDLKPGNVLLFPCECGCGLNHIKLADFGLAKIAGINIFGKSHRGALLYTSPESLLFGIHEAPKDIWAIGCMVVEMMTGRPAWRFCESRNELVTSIALHQPEIPEGISILGKDFLKRCFERNPNARWTADMLLNHPFIANEFNLLSQELEDHQASVNGPFAFGGWSSNTGLFSTTWTYRPRPAAPPCMNQCVLLEKMEKDLALGMNLMTLGH